MPEDYEYETKSKVHLLYLVFCIFIIKQLSLYYIIMSLKRVQLFLRGRDLQVDYSSEGIIIKMNTFEITQKIGQVYPDVEDEICSKHTIHLNQAAKIFNKYYPGCDPTHYVIVNQTVRLAKGQSRSLQMALERGLVLLLAPGNEEDTINISTSLTQQIILQNSGKILDSEREPQFSTLAKQAIGLAVDDLSLNKIKGGFIYLLFHDHQKLAKNQEKVLIALFMAAIIINGLRQQYDIVELMDKLKTLSAFKGKEEVVDNYFCHLSEKALLVNNNNEKELLMMPSGKRLIFMADNVLDAQYQLEEQALCQQTFDQALEQFEQEKIQFCQLMNMISQVQFKYIKNQALLDFIQKIVIQNKIKGFLLVQGYCVFLVENYRYAEVIGRISRLIHQSLPVPQEGSESEKLIQSHRSSALSAKVKSLIFSSAPSMGLAVLDPSNSLWFG